MSKSSQAYKNFQIDFAKNKGRLTHRQALKLFTAMWEEARSFGILPAKDPMEGIAVDIRIAKVLNSCLKNSFPE
jgi:hypothetical protein